MPLAGIPALRLAPDAAGALDTLASSEMPPDLARAVVEGAIWRRPRRWSAGAGSNERFRRGVAEELVSRFTVQSTWGFEARPRVAAW